MNTLQAAIGNYNAFLKQLLQEVVAEGFDLADFVQMDHICYRVPSMKRYKIKKHEFAAIGKFLGEVEISGRPISTFRLHTPIRYENWRIDAVELPAPKDDTPTKEGLEHVEFVLFDDMQDFLKKYAGKQFAMGASNRGVNPEVGFKLPSYGVKFHLLNLPTVIYLEQKLGLTAL